MVAAAMMLSEDEQRQWHELEARLAHHRRLVTLSARLQGAGQRADGAAAISAAACVWGVLAGCFGLVMITVGALINSNPIEVVGTGILAATLLLMGTTLCTTYWPQQPS